MGLIFLYLSVALAISFLCSLLEAILLSTPTSFIILKESQGVKGARLLRDLKSNIDRPISAILSLNTVAHTIGAAGVGAEAVKLYGEEYFGIISVVLTIIILVLSEIIPKTIGATYWQALSIPAAKMIRMMIFICYPLVRLSELLTDAIDNKKDDTLVSKEEVLSMVEFGLKSGVITHEEIKAL